MDLIAEKRAALEMTQGPFEDEHIELVNQFSQMPLSRNDVYIRSMYLCNDIIDAYASCFTKESLEEICGLIVGESVLKGHQHSSLPIARFFKAKVVERDDHNWVRAWFYWIKDTEGSLDLQRNIDGGIYREVSISWRYQTATCSICSQDIRKCAHIPGDYYDDELCFYKMSDICEVLEGSLVFKGGQKGTFLTGERSAKSNISDEKRNAKKQSRKIAILEEENRSLSVLAKIGKRRIKEIKQEIIRFASTVSQVEKDQSRLLNIQKKLSVAEIDFDLLLDYWNDFKRDFDRLFPPRRLSQVADLDVAVGHDDSDSYRVHS